MISHSQGVFNMAAVTSIIFDSCMHLTRAYFTSLFNKFVCQFRNHLPATFHSCIVTTAIPCRCKAWKVWHSVDNIHSRRRSRYLCIQISRGFLQRLIGCIHHVVYVQALIGCVNKLASCRQRHEAGQPTSGTLFSGTARDFIKLVC